MYRKTAPLSGLDKGPNPGTIIVKDHYETIGYHSQKLQLQLSETDYMTFASPTTHLNANLLD